MPPPSPGSRCGPEAGCYFSSDDLAYLAVIRMPSDGPWGQSGCPPPGTSPRAAEPLLFSTFTASEFPPLIVILQANTQCVSVIYRNFISQRGCRVPYRGRRKKKKRVKLKPWAKQESTDWRIVMSLASRREIKKRKGEKKPKPI